MDDNDTLQVCLDQKKVRVGFGLAAIAEREIEFHLYCPTEIVIFKGRSSFLLNEGVFR